MSSSFLLNGTITYLGHKFLMRIIEITREPVELYKILKFEGLASSGAEAKRLIDDQQVTVNGDIETRRRKKISTGDVIGFGGEQLGIKLI
mgnify:CR=1 FL=1|jgi:ribosome-associated protein